MQGHVLIAENESTVGKEINICSNSEISMQEILDKIKHILHSDAVVESEPRRMRRQDRKFTGFAATIPFSGAHRVQT